VTLTHPAQQVFKVELLEPAGGPPLQVTWLVDGNPFTSTARNVFTYTTDLAHLGQVEISLQVQDVTPLVHPYLRVAEMSSEQSWNVGVLRPVTLTLSADPASLPADGISTSVITATVTDLSGSPAAGEAVTFTTSLGAIQPVTTTANAAGLAFANLTAATQPGEALITASTATGARSLRLPMLAGFPAAVTLNASPAVVPPQGTATITALVRDALGEPLPGVNVLFSTTLGTLTPLQALTGPDGRASVTLAAGPDSGEALILAQAGKVSGSLSVPIRVITYLPLVLRQ
jgi:hypothetical protein